MLASISTEAMECLEPNLFRDLEIVDTWNQKLADRLPVTYNHLLQGGYLNMPSARMGCAGEVGVGYSYVSPYTNYNCRLQLLERLELSANYRLFRGIPDPVLSPYGFGDMSDKGANVKFAILLPEDTDYQFPGLAFGFEDFMGTRSFKANYVVATQVILPLNLEMSVGFGGDRIDGLFGGATWFPFRKSCNSYARGLSFTAEYDPTKYGDPDFEPHPDGRKRFSYWNYGVKYRLWDLFDVSVARIRGYKWAFSASLGYNFGQCCGFITKYEDPLPYRAPINTEPLGEIRNEEMMVHDLYYAFQCQGFELLSAWLAHDRCGDKVLRLEVYNTRYSSEWNVKTRFNYLLASLTPEDIDEVVIVLQSDGFPIQEYRYPMDVIRCLGEQQLCSYELEVLTPRREVCWGSKWAGTCLFKRSQDPWNLILLPKTHFFFGSAKGKFKYALGLSAGLEGYFSDDIFYSLHIGYIPLSDLDDVKDVDRLNPSQIINVRTDAIRYFQERGITVDEAYLQKNWNMGNGWYSRVALGLFEYAYGGAATEFLFYPACSRFACGVEGACLRKRTYSGVGFSDKVRQLHNFYPTYRHYLGWQYFGKLYYDWRESCIDFRIKAGQFLAKDIGVRTEVSRYFESGFRISFWYTYTNGQDFVNNQRYHDKGIAFSMPLDIFYPTSSRERWGYGMAAWLRDVGAVSATGKELYDLIHNQRQ